MRRWLHNKQLIEMLRKYSSCQISCHVFLFILYMHEIYIYHQFIINRMYVSKIYNFPCIVLNICIWK